MSLFWRAAVFFTLLCVVSPYADAEDMSITQVLSEVREGSPRLQRAHSSLEENSWKRVEAYSGFLPTVSITGQYLTQKKYAVFDVRLPPSPTAATIPQIIPTTNYFLTAQFPLFDGFASTNHLRSAQSFEASAKNDYDWTRFQVEREAILLFYRALASQTLKDVSEQSVKTLSDHLKDVQLFKKAGLSTKYDVLRIEVQLSEAQSELLNTEDNVVVAKGRLAELMGKEAETRGLAGQLPILSSEVVKSIKSDDAKTRQDIKSLNQRVEALDFQQSSANRYLIPRIALFGQYQYYNNINDRFDDYNAFRNAYQLGLSLNWTLFDGMVSASRSQQVVEQRVQAEKTARIAELRARQDVDYWKRKLAYFANVYQSRMTDIQRSVESARLAREGRKFGVRTSTELLDAELDLFRARAGAINAQLGAIEALIQLELATGQSIYSFN